MRRNAYSDEDIATMRTMKADGKSFAEIGQAISRDPHAVSQKWIGLMGRKGSQGARGPYKKQTKEVVVATARAPREAPHRPMIALVGTPAEVTATIRELFS